MIGTIATEYATAVKLAYLSESKRVDVKTGTRAGGGNHETRPEYLTIYETVEIVANNTSTQFAVVAKDALSATRVTDAKTDLNAKVLSGKATDEEIKAAALNGAVTLDATWPVKTSDGKSGAEALPTK